MANDFNKVVLVGRLTRDPEFKMIGSSSVVDFSIANGRTYVSNGEKKEETNFIDCEAWGKLADIFKNYTKKGKQVLIEGRLKQSTWDTPDGKKASKIRVQVENMQLLGSRDDVRPGGSDSVASSHSYESPGMEPGIDEIGVEDIF